MNSRVLGGVPIRVIEFGRAARSLVDWVQRGCVGYAPQFVKRNVLAQHCIRGAPWIETGTYLGTTTRYLARRAPRVHSIEPAVALYKLAKRRFRDTNVVLHCGTSEDVLPRILPTLTGPVNFWLDGHYSAGLTYRGAKESPLLDELEAIRTNLPRLTDVAIFIDDIRCCTPPTDGGYPTLDELVGWARQNGFAWQIDQDIMILRRCCTPPRT